MTETAKKFDAVGVARDVLDLEIQGLAGLRKALADSKGELAAALNSAVAACKQVNGQVIVTGIGKSGHIARKIASTLASTGTRSMYIHPAEASHGDLGMISEHDIILALSNSGETSELGDLIAYAGRFGIRLIAMTSGTDSALAKAADITLLVPKSDEACAITRAPTTSTTQMLALGDALAVATLRARGFTSEDFHAFHPGGKLGASMKRVRDLMHHSDMPLCPADTPLNAAIAEMSRGGFGCVGLTGDQGRLEGIITDGDLRRHIGKIGQSVPASEIMTRDPMVITDNTLAATALGIFSKQKITALFIVDDDQKPVGILHVHDCLSTGVM